MAMLELEGELLDSFESIDTDNDSLEIGFNYRYLLDILGQVKGDTVRMKLQDGTSPVILQDETDHSSLFVLMPMRV